ncbi:MAG: restriction endonuclease subunit S, partial [Colwellia sp.]
MKYKAEPNSPTVGAPSARRVKLMPRGYKVYSSYKDSGVEWLGDIPDEWIVKRSKYVFNEINNRTATGEEDLLSVSEYYGVKPRSSVMSSGEHLSRAESLVDYKKCSKDNLVINIMLAWKRGLGVSKYDGIVSPAYCVFKAITPVEPYYMHDLFRTNLYTKRFKSKSTGVIDSRLRLYPEMFGTIETLLPPLQEQKSIANYLDKATTKIDTLIEKQTKLIALLKEKRQAVISSAVTRGLDASVPMKDSGVEWLGEIPEGWKVSKITHYGEVTKLTGFEYTNKWKTT